ncbi:MAG: FHA domain-containing protein [Xylophilus ampelinus]
MSRRILVSLDTATVVDATLDQECITLGRRPYNDIVLDHRSVSGEHAVLRQTPEGTLLEDRNSTNGTFVNGQKVVQQRLLEEGDAVEIGRYRIRIQDLAAAPTAWVGSDAEASAFASLPSASASGTDADADMSVSVSTAEMDFALFDRAASPPAAMPARLGRITVISGPASGRTVELRKPVSTLGKRGTAIALVQREDDRYLLAHAEGDSTPVLNGEAIGFTGAVALQHDDVVELAGALLHFELAEAA